MKKTLIFSLSLFATLIWPVTAKAIDNDNEIKSEAQRQALMKSIEFVEVDDDIELGPELLRYLPEDFNPYKGMIFDSKELHFEEIEENIELGSAIKNYLPKNFNPYIGQ